MTGLLFFFVCGDGGIGFNRTFTLDWSVVFWDCLLFDRVTSTEDEVVLSKKKEKNEIEYLSKKNNNLLGVSSDVERVSFGDDEDGLLEEEKKIVQ